jgi:acyl-CoA thioesterase FadM
MARIKLTLPDKIIGTVSIPVRITDINYGNHVGNDSFISILHEARVLWLKQHEFSELNVAGVGLIMGGLAIEFKNESFYGDILEINISSGEITSIGFELFYRLTTERNGKSIIISNAKTDMICFDYENKKVVPIPEALKQLLNKKI